MNHFGNLEIGPTPPRKDGNAQSEGQQEVFASGLEAFESGCSVLSGSHDEFDSTYEAPPFERPLNVPQMPKEENAYMERTPEPPVPRRQQAPPLRTNLCKHKTEDKFSETWNMKPPAVDRAGKPGRKKMPLPVAPKPMSEEEGVYLDPREQDSSDEIYLEPAEACSPPLREVKTTPLPPVFRLPPPLQEPLSKLTPDRLRSLTAAGKEMDSDVAPRWASSPKSPPVRPWRPTNLKDSVQDCVLEHKPGGKARISSTEGREWFAGNCSRKMAEDLLLSVKRDGAFLIRNSSTQSSPQPFTLAVLYQQKVYNIPVRFLDNAQGYALGKEGKKNEEIFNTLEDMVSHYKNNMLLLIDTKSQSKNTTYLTDAVRP